MEALIFLGLVLAALFFCLWLYWLSQEQKRKRLLEKYADAEIVQAILAGKIWQGMSEEMLVDSWGQPVEIDTKVMKRKENKTFKYERTGKNRFAKRVNVENGKVVGWQV